MEIEVIVHAQKPAWLRELQFDQSGNTEQVTRCKNIVHWMWDRQRTRIKVTLGITGLSRPIVHIDGAVWHLDVGSSHPGAEVGPKGSAVRRLKWYVSWVQNVVRQFGPYPSRAQETWRGLLLVREDRSGRTAGVPIILPRVQLGSYVRDG